MDIERACMVAIIGTIRNMIETERRALLTRPSAPPDDTIFDRACAAHGIAREAWEATLHAEPELEYLFRATLDEFVLDTPDPGPYDVISRESSSGVPVAMEAPARG